LITQRHGGAGIFTGWRRDRKCDEKIWSAAASGIPRDAAFKVPGAAASVCKSGAATRAQRGLVTALQNFRNP